MMTIDWTLCIRLLMLAAVAATLNVPPKSVLEKRLTEETMDEDDKRRLDHESFVGRDGAELFDKLSVDDSKDGIRIIYDKIDRDRNGRVTEDEMKNWMKKIHNRQVEMDADSYWSIYIGESDAELLTWETFRNATYGLDSDLDDIVETNEAYVTVRKSLRHYRHLWQKADQDGDGALNKRESRDFFLPEESNVLKDVIIDETVAELDGNNDGYISQEEYLMDVSRISTDDAARDPDWLEKERKLFVEVKDRDKDNRLSRDEVEEWLLPANFDTFRAEAQRLINLADTNQDGILSKEEIIENFDKFVGSQAMNFDKILEPHAEF